MSFIGCTSDCIYQTDGYCTLEHAATGGEYSLTGCIHYVQKTSYKYRNKPTENYQNKNE